VSSATPEQQRAFDQAAKARDAIADIIDRVRTAELDLLGAFAVADADPLAGRCFAVKVFEVVPDVGKVRARRTMDELGLADDVWLRDVPPDTRLAIASVLDQAT